MTHTRHANARMQQRSISPEILRLLKYYGEEVKATRGANILYFGRRARQMIKGDYGEDYYRKHKSFFNVYLVIFGDRIITVGRRYKKIRH